MCVTVFTYGVLKLWEFNTLQELLTAPLAGAYFLGFLGVVRTCRKSPMISRRKLNIIPFYQT